MNFADLFNNLRSPRSSVAGLLLAITTFAKDLGIPLEIPGWVGIAVSVGVTLYLMFFVRDKKPAPAPVITE